jgi:hypothetical protein
MDNYDLYYWVANSKQTSRYYLLNGLFMKNKKLLGGGKLDNVD